MQSDIKSIVLLWRHDKLHLFLIGYFVLVYSWMYRVALRAFMDGAEFRWVTVLNTQMLGEERRAFLGGNGMDGHFVVVLAFAVFFSFLLYSLIRRPDGVTKSLFIAWIGIFLLHQITVALGLGTDYVVRGDTIGLVLPFYIIGPAQHLLMLALAVVWILRDRTSSLEFPPLEKDRLQQVWRWLAAYPLIFLLFRVGEQHGTSDQLGIVLLYATTVRLIFLMFYFRLRK